MHILYPTVGRHPTKGCIDFRWQYTSKSGFLVAFGPCNCRSLWRALVWFVGQRRRENHPVFLLRRECGSRQREERALDALIVSQLRAPQDDEVDVRHLPELTDKDREALDSLGPDFISRLLAGEIKRPEGPGGRQ